MTRRADPIEELALELLEAQRWSSEDARCLAEDYPDGEDRDRLMERIAQLAEERENEEIALGVFVTESAANFRGRQDDFEPYLTRCCYDFPELVVHHPGCPRYRNGGICRPLPQPVEPYSPEERSAVEAYEEAIAGRLFGVLIRATGATQYPAGDTRKVH